jgi:pimeloyl-ACP methyl ester carboxylesterase
MAVTIYPPGLVLTEREFDVPLRYSDPDGERITVFAREVAAPDGRDRPFLVFLQGGPGMEAPRPTAHPSVPGWLERALKDFRVLMLDQRGTGRSTPVATLKAMSPEEQAGYLACFRADSIVKDAEFIRNELGVERWSVLGQSFGGFCVLHYMSAAPGGLAEAFLTGGLPPVGRHPDEVYRATYARTLQRCRRYYERYPADRERVRRLQAWVAETDVILPGGDRLTQRMFRQLGHMLGMSDGAEHLHYIMELPEDSPGFLHDLEAGLPPFSRTACPTPPGGRPNRLHAPCCSTAFAVAQVDLSTTSVRWCRSDLWGHPFPAGCARSPGTHQEPRCTHATSTGRYRARPWGGAQDRVPSPQARCLRSHRSPASGHRG